MESEGGGWGLHGVVHGASKGDGVPLIAFYSVPLIAYYFYYFIIIISISIIHMHTKWYR